MLKGHTPAQDKIKKDEFEKLCNYVIYGVH